MAGAGALVRSPWLHFFLLGGLMWILLQAAEVTGLIAQDVPVVKLSDADLREARRRIRVTTGQSVAPRPLAVALRARIDERILVEEALRQNLHRSDPVVRRRLIDNMRLAQGGAAMSDAQLLREAELLSMPRQDVLVRRRLIEIMQRRLAGHHAPPDDAVLAAFIAEQPQRFGSEARIGFEQRLFAGSDAQARLRAEQWLAGEGDSTTDPSLFGERFRGVGERDIARIFGPTFAAAVTTLPEGEWHGPLSSVQGWHLVRVFERQAAQPAELDQVRMRAAYAWNEAQRSARIEAGLEALRQRYRVEMDSAPVSAALRAGLK